MNKINWPVALAWFGILAAEVIILLSLVSCLKRG